MAARDRGDPVATLRAIGAAMEQLAQLADRLDPQDAMLMRAVAERFRAALLRGDVPEAKQDLDVMFERSGADIGSRSDRGRHAVLIRVVGRRSVGTAARGNDPPPHPRRRRTCRRAWFCAGALLGSAARGGRVRVRRPGADAQLPAHPAHLPQPAVRVARRRSSAGGVALLLQSAESNDIATTQGAIEATLKFETNRTVFGARYGLFERWEVGIELPFISRYGGFLDPIIDGVEDLFGAGNPERDLFPQNAFGAFVVARGDTVAVRGRRRDLSARRSGVLGQARASRCRRRGRAWRCAARSRRRPAMPDDGARQRRARLRRRRRRRLPRASTA